MTGLDSIFGATPPLRLLPLFIMLIVFLFIEWWFDGEPSARSQVPWWWWLVAAVTIAALVFLFL